MKRSLQKMKLVPLVIIFFIAASLQSYAQTCEWQLTNVVYNGTDPDAGGPAVGSVTFDLQVRSTGANIPNVDVLSVGWSWQSANAMVPTTPGCGIVSNPANVTMLPPFSTASFAFTTVNQCNTFSQTTGGQTFNRRVTGSVDGGLITLTSTFVNVFRVTLWALAGANPQAGYVVINSGNGGSPGAFGTYSISDNLLNEYVTNSLTYTTALSLGSGALPVLFTNYNVQCNDKGALLTWGTATEQNTSKFEIQRSKDGANWVAIDNVTAAGNSTSDRSYQYLDLQGGAAFYRIRQVDADGKSVYTDIKRTSCESKNFTVVLYPVPAKENLMVIIKSDKAVRTELQIMDISGRLIRRIPTQINSGNNNINLDVNDLAAGQYLLTSSDPELPINKKFVIAR